MNNPAYILLIIMSIFLTSCQSTKRSDVSKKQLGNPAPQNEEMEKMFNAILLSDAGFYCVDNISGLEMSIILRKIWGNAKPRAENIEEFIECVDEYNKNSRAPIYVRDENTGRKKRITIWLKEKFLNDY